MDFAPVYIISRLGVRFYLFFYHWYVDGTRAFARAGANIFLGLEQGFALRLTIVHFFQPLYQDYSVIGRIIGPIFRILRLALGSLFYILAFVLIITAYAVWIFLLPALVWYGLFF